MFFSIFSHSFDFYGHNVDCRLMGSWLYSRDLIFHLRFCCRCCFLSFFLISFFLSLSLSIWSSYLFFMNSVLYSMMMIANRNNDNNTKIDYYYYGIHHRKQNANDTNDDYGYWLLFLTIYIWNENIKKKSYDLDFDI